jgi:protein tyrosine phosphatase
MNSAGVGRTGTFCAIHIMIQQYKYYLKKMQELGCDPDNQIDEEKRFNFNIYNIIKQLKNQRIGMVQRKEQYVFCYTTLQRWLDRQRGYTPL